MAGKIREFFVFARRHPLQAAFLAVITSGFINYGSTKPDVPPVVEEKGIALTECAVNSQGLSVKWNTDDDRVIPGKTVFIIEARERPMMLGKRVIFQPTNAAWYEIGRTTDFEIAQPGVWTDKTREIRVRTIIEGSGE
jgi:hypothetical protein